MSYYLACALVFLLAYAINCIYITVFYHRGLTHGAVRLKPWTRAFVVATGSWVTGLDPKGWSTMHRLHHLHADLPEDPHSPLHQGVFGLALGQLRSYEKTLVCLSKGVEPHVTIAQDLDFDVNWLNRKKLWFVPYVLHLALSVAFAALTGYWLFAYAYYVGIMSHPIQGWMVNALGHRFGYRTYDTPDNSRNNTVVSWLVAGEGYQNNHHHRPQAAKFSVRWFEVDWGYLLCWGAEKLGLIEIVGTDRYVPRTVPVPV